MFKDLKLAERPTLYATSLTTCRIGTGYHMPQKTMILRGLALNVKTLLEESQLKRILKDRNYKHRADFVNPDFKWRLSWVATIVIWHHDSWVKKLYKLLQKNYLFLFTADTNYNQENPNAEKAVRLTLLPL